MLFDLEMRQVVDLATVNTSKYDERRAALSGDGSWMAYTTNNPDGSGLTDIRLYDIQSKQIVTASEMNSAATDSFPSLTRDGRLICFPRIAKGATVALTFTYMTGSIVAFFRFLA